MKHSSSPSKRPLRAFTLIELLIVVAIIAILAAIAVPNFLEAQVRAKVSRVKSDMRSLATAIEAYAVDNNKYPYYNNPLDEAYATQYGNRATPIADGRYELRAPVSLTTPIAYMTSLLPDAFPNVHGGEERSAGHPFHWCIDQDPYTSNLTAAAGPDQFPAKAIYSMVAQSSDAPTYYSSESVQWVQISHGPDVDHDNPDEGAHARAYDPTNGTVSSGDIYMFGPGQGFGK